MECPRDQHALIVRHHEGCAYEGCPDCGGHFLEPGLLRQTLGLEAHDSAEQIRESRLPTGTLRCPIDATPRRILIHDGVEIDLCPDCGGVWLDPGELEAIARRRPRRNNREERHSGNDVHLGGGASHAPGSDALDAATESGGLLGDVVDFVGNALGSLFDGL